MSGLNIKESDELASKWSLFFLNILKYKHCPSEGFLILASQKKIELFERRGLESGAEAVCLTEVSIT